MIRVIQAERTCGACPSQWEGLTDDGRHVYARYRWGTLTVGVAPTFDDAVMGPQLVQIDHGGEYDGYLDEETLKLLTADVIEWPRALGGGEA